MIATITSLELDVLKFPHIISAYNGKQLVKKWEFTSVNDAKQAQSEIWKEIFKAKTGGKDGIKAISN